MIITPRLVLRSLRSDDGPAIASATEETWSDLSQWMRWAINRENLTDPIQCRAYAVRCHDAFAQEKDFTFGGFLKETGEFVLISRLVFLEWESGSYEFGGYWCRKSYQGQGYMSETVNALTRYVFEHWGAKKLKIAHAAGNHKTRAVMDRLGFMEEQILKDAHPLPDGSVVDEYILVRTNQAGLPTLNVTWGTA